MRTKLTPMGDDAALVLEPALLEQLGLDENSEVEVSIVDGGLLVARFSETVRDRKLREREDD